VKLYFYHTESKFMTKTFGSYLLRVVVDSRLGSVCNACNLGLQTQVVFPRLLGRLSRMFRGALQPRPLLNQGIGLQKCKFSWQ
jgi:hypothetical protein